MKYKAKEGFQVGDLVKVQDYSYIDNEEGYLYKLGIIVYASLDAPDSQQWYAPGDPQRWYRVMIGKDCTVDRFHKDTHGPYDV